MIYLAFIVTLFCFLHRKEALGVAVALVVMNGAHHLIEPFMPDLGVYVSAGVMDFSLIALITAFWRDKEFAFDLSVLCLLSLICNLLGFLLYNAYYSPYIYDTAAITIIMLQFMRLLVKRDGGDTPGGRRLSMVRISDSFGSESNHGAYSAEEGREA